MNLAALENNTLIAIVSPKQGVDMDAISHLGPEISRHFTAISNLCDYIPNSDNLKDHIEELKSLFATYIPMQDNVLEKEQMQESVIYRLDTEDPMNKSEILILGGAGRYSMAGLRTKAAREAAQLADDLSSKHADYRGSAHSVKQVANTINTMVAALDELKEIRSKGGKRSRGIENIDETSIEEQHVKHDALKAVGMLHDALVKYGKAGHPITDDAVNTIMKKVLNKTRHTDMNSLLQTWKSSKFGLTPLQWAKETPDIHDTNIHKTSTEIEETVTSLGIMEMYETMKVGLGERAWVAISRRLKAEGYDPELVEEAVNHAICSTGNIW